MGHALGCWRSGGTLEVCASILLVVDVLPVLPAAMAPAKLFLQETPWGLLPLGVAPALWPLVITNLPGPVDVRSGCELALLGQLPWQDASACLPILYY